MKNSKWFTIVELIVVVTIISILGAIWFVSYTSYIWDSRDSSRISQVSSMYKALETYRAKWFLPMPSESVNIYASGTIIWYQWYAWENVLNTIWYQDEWKDPKDEEYFTYYLTKDLRRAQIMTLLEDELTVSYDFINQANALDYSDRVVKVYGNKLWILTESWTNVPIQALDTIISSWWLDIVKTTSTYTAYLTDDNKITWTWYILAYIWYWWWKNCKEILSNDSWKKWLDWVYYINPTWTGSFQVYCDMTTDWWGWTLVANIQTINANISSSSYDVGLSTPNLTDLTTWAWIMDADLYDAIWQVVKVKMGTVVDYFKPVTWNTIKTMLMSYTKQTWSNTADWTYITPWYYSTHLWWSSTDWPKNNISWDWRRFLTFWGWWWLNSWCCHSSYSDTATWWKKFSMWLR